MKCPYCKQVIEPVHYQRFENCKVCGYRWKNRTPEKSSQCPKCHSIHWEDGDHRTTLICHRCSYVWKQNKETRPSVCPNCHSLRWDKDIVPGRQRLMQLIGIADFETLMPLLREKLNLREYTVVVMRYGLNSQYAQTLEKIGQRFNVTRERIRQIEKIALRKLGVSEGQYVC